MEDMISDKLNLIDRCVKKEERTDAISFATKCVCVCVCVRACKLFI